MLWSMCAVWGRLLRYHGEIRVVPATRDNILPNEYRATTNHAHSTLTAFIFKKIKNGYHVSVEERRTNIVSLVFGITVITFMYIINII